MGNDARSGVRKTVLAAGFWSRIWRELDIARVCASRVPVVNFRRGFIMQDTNPGMRTRVADRRFELQARTRFRCSGVWEAS